MLIEGMDKVIIVPGGGYGWRQRAGNREFHYGVDIRVVDEDKNVLKVLAPEKMFIAEVNFDPQWGHWIKARPFEPNELGIDEFRFWHQKPEIDCIPDQLFDENVPISTPESGYVALHLHFATLMAGQFHDPMPYIKLRRFI